MKFKLFGRLRDDEESSTGNQGLSGGSLERTVENMFQQGYSEEEIQEELEGRYSEQEINQAVNNTVTSSATDGSKPEPMTPYTTDSDEAVSPMDAGYDGEPAEDDEKKEFSEDQNNYQPQQQTGNTQTQNPGYEGSQQMQGSLGGYNNQNIDPAVEELIETIVAEQFGQVENQFSKVYEEIDIIIEELESLEDRVQELEIRDDEDQQQFVQKVDEMEDHIDSYQSRIGGLEKAFQQVLPSLVENVKDLTSLVQEIKDDKGIETSTSLEESDVEDIDMSDW